MAGLRPKAKAFRAAELSSVKPWPVLENETREWGNIGAVIDA
jgi:hypothetical protein